MLESPAHPCASPPISKAACPQLSTSFSAWLVLSPWCRVSSAPQRYPRTCPTTVKPLDCRQVFSLFCSNRIRFSSSNKARSAKTFSVAWLSVCRRRLHTLSRFWVSYSTSLRSKAKWSEVLWQILEDTVGGSTGIVVYISDRDAWHSRRTRDGSNRKRPLLDQADLILRGINASFRARS